MSIIIIIKKGAKNNNINNKIDVKQKTHYNIALEYFYLKIPSSLRANCEEKKRVKLYPEKKRAFTTSLNKYFVIIQKIFKNFGKQNKE